MAGGIKMRFLINIRFDAACKKAAAAMLVCVAVLIVCGALRYRETLPQPGRLLAAAFGDVAACAVITLYACTFAYAASNALSEEVGSFGEFVMRSGHIFCASGAAAQVIKLIFLLPCSGTELIGGAVLIADAAVSWIFLMKVFKNRVIIGSVQLIADK